MRSTFVATLGNAAAWSPRLDCQQHDQTMKDCLEKDGRNVGENVGRRGKNMSGLTDYRFQTKPLSSRQAINFWQIYCADAGLPNIFDERQRLQHATGKSDQPAFRSRTRKLFANHIEIVQSPRRKVPSRIAHAREHPSKSFQPSNSASTNLC